MDVLNFLDAICSQIDTLFIPIPNTFLVLAMYNNNSYSQFIQVQIKR